MPFRDDLVQRTIQQITQTLAYLLGARDQASFERLMEVVDETYREQVGLRRQLMRHLDGDQLLDILSSAGHLDRERAFLVAELLRAEAEGLAARNRPVHPELRLKALDLTLAAALAGLDVDELPERVVEHQEALEEIELPEGTLWRLFHYRVARGGYAGAEDLLFEAIERFGPHGEAARQGRAFYRALHARSDRELRRGGLPRSEVREGEAELERTLRGLEAG